MSKKIGSKLAESVKQSRGNRPGETARPEATRPLSSPPASDAPVAGKPPARTLSQEPAVSHGVLHPPRIWPD